MAPQDEDATRAAALRELREFKLEAIDRLARIETHAEGFVARLEEHTQQDRENFAEIDKALDAVVLDVAVARAAGGAEGRKRATVWASAISAVAVGGTEILRALGVF